MSASNSDIIKGRRCLSFLLFTGNGILYSMRVNLSVAIVAMVSRVEVKSSLKDGVTDLDTCPVEPSTSPTGKDDYLPVGEFDWDETTQGFILGSFFWGYTLTNILGGVLAERFGGRLVYGLGITFTALLTILSPLAAHHSTTAFLAIRVLEGMTEGVTFPALNVLMSHWVPLSSRSSFLSFVLSGASFGTVITLGITGWLCESYYGWPSSFVLFGLVGLVWALFWFMLITDTPPSHGGGSEQARSPAKLGGAPWRSILTSPAFLCVVVAHTASNWGFYCLLTEMPTYLAHVLHFDVHTNGVISSLPYVAKWLMLMFYSAWIDRSIQMGRFTLRRARRMSAFLGLVVPGLLLVSIPLAGCERGVVVLILCLAVGISGADHCGHLCAYQDLAPRYAGTLAGLSNTIGTLPGFLAPQLTGYLTKEQGSLSSWRSVFGVASVFYWIGAAIYLQHMSVQEQPWGSSSYHKKKSGRVPLLAEDASTFKA